MLGFFRELRDYLASDVIAKFAIPSVKGLIKDSKSGSMGLFSVRKVSRALH